MHAVSQAGMFAAIVGGMLFLFLMFALVITPYVICPPTMQNPKTTMADPIVQLCDFVVHKSDTTVK